MIVRDIMAKTPIWLEPQSSLMNASRYMRDRDIGCVLVGDKDLLVGMVTDRDIATRAVAKGWDPRPSTVKDVMTRGVVYCNEAQKVREAAKLMEGKRVRRLAVLDAKKRLVGVVSVADIARAANGALVGEVMNTIYRPAPGQGLGPTFIGTRCYFDCETPRHRRHSALLVTLREP